MVAAGPRVIAARLLLPTLQVCLSFYEKRQRQSWFRCGQQGVASFSFALLELQLLDVLGPAGPRLMQHHREAAVMGAVAGCWHFFDPFTAFGSPCRSTAEERLYWEQWLVDVTALPPPPADFEERNAFASSSLRAQRRQRVQVRRPEGWVAVEVLFLVDCPVQLSGMQAQSSEQEG